MTTSTIPTTDFDFFDAAGDLKDQNFSTGFRKCQHMNESVQHRGTEVYLGGYAINDTDGTAPAIGPSQLIKHRGDRSTQMRCAKMVTVAVIGVSPVYYICEMDDVIDPLKKSFVISPRYVKPEDMPGTNGKCRSAMSFFVAFKNDPKRELYEVAFRGYNTDSAKKLVGQLKSINTDLANSIKAQTGKVVNVLSFAHWMPLGVIDDSIMVGQVEKSPVTPPQWKLEAQAPERVSKEDYLKFIEMRRELDEYLAAQPYAVKPQAQMTAPAPKAQIGAPAAGNDDDVNI
jgi:hypothetical protein